MTKVDIISGFLGAGKTTFIKKLIDEVFTGEKLVLIENEFGEIGIDGGFLKDAGIEITEMNSGCICCTLVGDFSKALQQVLEQYHPDRVIIEPSGVGKLSDVAKAVEGVKAEADIEISGRITVVDGKKAKMYMKNFGEFFKDQVASATTLVLSRTQMMTDEKIEECVHLLREENKEAAVITTPWDELGKEAILRALEQGAEIEELLEEATVMLIIMAMNTTTTTKNAAAMTMSTAITMTTTMTMGSAAVMTTTTTMSTIITTTQMRCLQAGAGRRPINIRKKNWISC